MNRFIGCISVFMAFVLLRFFFTYPKNLWHRLSPILQSMFSYFQLTFYWGLLIIGLVLCFVANIKTGLLALGCFLYFYMMSLSVLSLNRIPFLYNKLAGLAGMISLIVGLALSFITSIKYGFIATGCVLLTFLIIRCLMHIEIVITKKKRLERD